MNSKQAAETANGIVGCLCLICMALGLIAAIFEHLTLTIFFSTTVIAMQLQPDAKPED